MAAYPSELLQGDNNGQVHVWMNNGQQNQSYSQ